MLGHSGLLGVGCWLLHVMLLLSQSVPAVGGASPGSHGESAPIKGGDLQAPVQETNGCHVKSGARCMLPRFTPTWDMRMSTIFMPCNDSGFHDVQEAIQYGIVSYDWSNAKQLWVNHENGTLPMNDEELLTQQAGMVMAADRKPNRTKVWIYRNTIKALNWFSSVREKLDDDAYSGWFIKLDPRSGNYSQPQCDTNWHPPKCSPFWHDQAQSPGFPKGDGTCERPCFCGKNPCGEYIFDHRNASFSNWFLNEWMISNETLLHDGIDGLLLDDHMFKTGPTETHGHFLADTGLSTAAMADSVAAYNANMNTLWSTIVQAGGFAWDLFQGGNFFGVKEKTPQCLSSLRSICGPQNQQDATARFWKMSPGPGLLEIGGQYTAAFLLTRGIYAWIGFEWAGCRSTRYPRPLEWDADYGTPLDNCTEIRAAAGEQNETGRFVRHWSKATVEWNCMNGTGSITMLEDPDGRVRPTDTGAAVSTHPLVQAQMKTDDSQQERLSTACTMDEDCSLNGRCVDGACACVPEWRGHDCGLLNLLPARSVPQTAGFDEPGSSSWGGSLLLENDTYHLFASRMVFGCGLTEWSENSEIVHATSSDAEGPYTVNSTVVPHFAHGPSVRRLGSGGGFVLMHLGCGGGGNAKNCSAPPGPAPPGPAPPVPPPPSPSQHCAFSSGVDYKGGGIATIKGVSSAAECCGACQASTKACTVAVFRGSTCFLKSSAAHPRNCTTCTSCKPTASTSSSNPPPHPKCSGPFNVSIKTSLSINGPWSPSEHVGLIPGTQEPSWFEQRGKTFTNPAPFLLPNGSVIVAYRANCQSKEPRCGGEHVSLATADSIRGPFVDSRPRPLITQWSEDPYLWMDERGHFHMLMHSPTGTKPPPGNGKSVGAHAYSRDALNWTVSKTNPYTTLVNYSNGTSFDMRRRERPQLLLSDRGQPRFFLSGVEDYSDHTWTLVMKFHSADNVV